MTFNKNSIKYVSLKFIMQMNQTFTQKKKQTEI